jgi:hypothetical protein
LTDDQLTFHVDKSELNLFSPADNIINNDLRVGVIINFHTFLLCKLLLDAVDVMDKIDESCWPIGGSEWHKCKLPLDCVNTLECKLLLTLRGYCQLMISHRRMEHPTPPSLLRLIMNSQIAAWNWVCDELGDGIEWNEIHTEAPDKFINTVNVLLVWLRCKERFK